MVLRSARHKDSHPTRKKEDVAMNMGTNISKGNEKIGNRARKGGKIEGKFEINTGIG
jgi:hypothetical protein